MPEAKIAERRLRNRRLREVARRCVWWQKPSYTLRRQEHFLAHVMTFGEWNDIQIMREFYSSAELRKALRLAPPGVFDPRSWHYWHYVLGIRKVPALPVRRIPGVAPAAATSKFSFHKNLSSVASR